ncbi:MAG: cytochrome c-type biogenesis protein [Oceanococcus sp.]
MNRLIAVALLLFLGQAVALTDQQEQRYRSLNNELRCLVCQNQSIAESNAPLAEDLRNQVKQMIEQGKTDQDIRLYMTQRYGDFVLYRPPFNPRTWLLWIGPFLMLLVGAFLVWRMRAAPTAPAANPPPSQHKDLTSRLKALDDE